MKGRTGIVVALLCLAGAGFLFLRDRLVRRREGAVDLPERFFYCEGCRSEFLDEGGKASSKCAACGERTSIIRAKRRCRRCELEFVQFDYDTSTNLVRYPDGRWSDRLITSRACTRCGSDDLESLPEKR